MWLFGDPKTIKTHEAVGKKNVKKPKKVKKKNKGLILMSWWDSGISTGSESGIKNDDFPSKIQGFCLPDLIIISKYCSIIL